MYQFTLIVWLFILGISLSRTSGGGSVQNTLRQARFPPCKACRTFIDSFKRGIERTSRGFEGGDTAWEEEKLGSYSKSEVRLVEIQENVCSEVEEGRDQCYSLHEEYDTDIEEWWFNNQESDPDLNKYFCIDKLKHCCPDLRYGPNCISCPGFPDNVCSKNGNCKGSGTRKGNGKCNCDEGYTGELCDTCDQKYFESYRDSNKILCSPCPPSCDGSCTKSGCEKCAVGWQKVDNGYCLDINECASVTACNPSQFCVNSAGSFQCLQCDKVCDGCTGDGPDICLKCAKGYIRFGNVCMDEDQGGRNQYIVYTRILTYIGLCIATCITYQKNVFVAGVIGFSVAIYIAVSEYVFSTPLQPNATHIAEKIMMGDN